MGFEQRSFDYLSLAEKLVTTSLLIYTDILVEIRREIKVNYSHFKPQPPPVAVPSPAEIQVQKRNVEEAATLEPSIAVLVIACNRENYIRQTLDNLLK